MRKRIKGPMPTQEELHRIFEYRDGHLYRRVRAANKMPGERVGALAHGYYLTMLRNRYCYVHRLIWMMFYGDIPVHIDHINRCGTDNRIENLRLATPAENSHNIEGHAGSKTGVKGVTWCNITRKWKVQLRVAGKNTYLGVYPLLADAAAAARAAREKYHGEFANHRGANELYNY